MDECKVLIGKIEAHRASIALVDRGLGILVDAMGDIDRNDFSRFAEKSKELEIIAHTPPDFAKIQDDLHECLRFFLRRLLA